MACHNYVITITVKFISVVFGFMFLYYFSYFIMRLMSTFESL